MGVLKSADIAKDKIKVRWNEKYVTEGIDTFLGALTPGVYRGGLVKETDAGADKHFHIVDSETPWTDSVYVVRDKSTGRCFAVRDTEGTGIDMSSQFTDGGKIPVGGAIWYVYVTVVYSPGGPDTTGQYVVASSAPTDQAVKIAKITMPGGATTILQSYISHMKPIDADTDETNRDVPQAKSVEMFAAYADNDNVLGLLSGQERWCIPTYNQKKAMNNASPEPTSGNPFVTEASTVDMVLAEPVRVPMILAASSSFKLTGTFYIGKDVATTAKQYFQAKQLVSGFYDAPILDASNGLIYVTDVKDSTNDHSLVPSAEADAEGFYTNPWIYLSDTVTLTAYIWCLKKKNIATLEQAPAAALANPFVRNRLHAIEIQTKDKTGNPNNWTSKSAQEVFELLLAAINNKSIDPNADSSTWRCIWRSGNIQTDAAVTIDTTSFYWRQGEFAIVKGGYLSGSNVIVNSCQVGDIISIITMGSHSVVFGTSSIQATHQRITASLVPISIPIYTSQCWTSWQRVGDTNNGTANPNMVELFQTGKSYSDAGPETFDDFRSAIYAGQIQSDEGIGYGLAANCIYQERSPGVWKWIVGNSSYDAWLLEINSVYGLTLYYKRAADSATPWLRGVGDGAWTDAFSMAARPDIGGANTYIEKGMMAKAWAVITIDKSVAHNGSGVVTVENGYGVSLVATKSVDVLTVNFSGSFRNEKYAVFATCVDTNLNKTIFQSVVVNKSASSVGLQMYEVGDFIDLDTLSNPLCVDIVVFGDL